MTWIHLSKTVLKKIVITGHTGFIGKHITNHFQKKYEVIGISKNKIQNSEIKQISLDINDLNEKRIKENIFAVIHCAGITNIKFCQENPEMCFETNLSGTLKTLEFARTKKAKFIFLSSSHVYGNPKKLPIRENHIRNPVSIYGASKFAAEICCKTYSNQYGMDVVILRPYSIYGPKEDDHFVIPNIISQIKKNKKIEIGNLYPKRDFIFISDVISAIELVVGKINGYNVFNVGTGKSYSIKEVCEKLIRISGKKIRIKSNKQYSRKNEINEIISDSTALKKLGWKPKISLTEGLEKTFFENYL